MKILNYILATIFFFIIAIIPWSLVLFIPEPFIDHLDNAGILLGYVLSCFGIVAAVFAYIKRKDIRRWFLRSKFENVGEPFDVPEENVEAIVIPVSRREQPEWILRWLKPKYVSFLFSQKSKNIAAGLANEFSKAPYQITFFPNHQDILDEKYILDSVDKTEIAKNQTKIFINHFLNQDIALEKIFVDTTGGTVPMSIGAFQMAEEMGVSSIYVIGKVNRLIKNPAKRDNGYPVFISKRKQ